MKLWSRLARRLFRAPPVRITPDEEHAQARRRLDAIERSADRLERLANDYREMERGLGR